MVLSKMPDSIFFIFSPDSCISLSPLCSLVVNVMQRDSIPSEVDYETRQGVYSICLQLARCEMILEPTHANILGYVTS